MPLQLQMGAFVLCTLALLCAFVPLSPTAAAAAPLSAGEGPLLRGSCTNIPTGFMSDVALAYSVAHPEVTLEQEVLLSPAAQASQFGNVTDYTVITAVISAANANANPDMLLLPLFTYALIPVYNLPLNDSTPHPQLVLTRSVLARIFRGNITRWSHPAIQSSNPGFLLPEEDITIVFTLTASGQQWATGLALFDAPFLAAIGGNPKSPVWPKNLFAAWKQVDTLVRTTATVAQTPYSISWSTFDVASAGGIAMAAMINILGNTVRASASSLSYATQTVAAGKNAVAVKLSSSLALSLNDAAGSEAWPLAFQAYAMVSRTTHRLNGTCATKKALVDFLYFLYTSPIVENIGREHGLTMLPTLVFQQMSMESVLAALQCDGQPVYASPSLLAGATSSKVRGNSGVAQLLSVQLTQYKLTADITADYHFERSDALTAWNQLDTRQAQVAVVAPDLLRAQGVWREEGYLSLPMYLVAAAPVASLPPAVSTRWAAANETMRLQYPLLPLSLSLDVLGLVFGGVITSWTDPQIVEFNQHLPYWFADDSETDKRITLVVCCSDTHDPQFITSHFLHTISQVPSFQTATGFVPTGTSSSIPGAPATFLPVNPSSLFPLSSASASDRWTLVPTEEHLTYVSSLQLGSFSYRLAESGLSDPKSPILDILIRVPDTDSSDTTGGVDFSVTSTTVFHTVQATEASMLACLPAGGGQNLAMEQRFDLFDVRSTAKAVEALASLAAVPDADDATAAACYPFTQLLSLAVPASFATESAESARQLLRMLEWFNDGDSVGLQLSTSGRGAVHLPSAVPALRRLNQAGIAGVTAADSESLLYPTPYGHLFDQQSLSVKLDPTLTFLCYLLAVVGAFVGFLLLEDPLFHAKTGKSTPKDLFNVVASAFVWSVAAIWPTFVLASNALSVQASEMRFDPILMLTCWLPVWGCITIALTAKLRSFDKRSLASLFASNIKNRRRFGAYGEGSQVTTTTGSSGITGNGGVSRASSTGASSKEGQGDEDIERGRRGSSLEGMPTVEVNPVWQHMRRCGRACRQSDGYTLVSTLSFVASLLVIEWMGLSALNIAGTHRALDAPIVAAGVVVVSVFAWLAIQLVFHLDEHQWSSSFFTALPIFAAHQFALRSMTFTHDQDAAAAAAAASPSSRGWDGTLLTLVSILLAAACCFILIAVQFYRNRITSQGWLRQVVSLKRDKRRIEARLEQARQKEARATERADQQHVLTHLISLLRPNMGSHLSAIAWSLTQGSTPGVGSMEPTVPATSTNGPIKSSLRVHVSAPTATGDMSLLGLSTHPASRQVPGGTSCAGDATHVGSPYGLRSSPTFDPDSAPGTPGAIGGGQHFNAWQGHTQDDKGGGGGVSNDHPKPSSRAREAAAAGIASPPTASSSVSPQGSPHLGPRTSHAIIVSSPNSVKQQQLLAQLQQQQTMKAPDPSDFFRTLSYLQSSLTAALPSDATSMLQEFPSPTLEAVLSHPVGVELFRASLRAQMSEESLLFYQYVRVYEHEPDASVRHELAMDLYHLFVERGAALEVNLPSQLVSHIATSLHEQERADRTLFNAAKADIFHLMLTNNWNKFKASHEYRILCTIMQQGNTR